MTRKCHGKKSAILSIRKITTKIVLFDCMINLHFHLYVGIFYVYAIEFKYFKYNYEYYQTCDFCIYNTWMETQLCKSYAFYDK